MYPCIRAGAKNKNNALLCLVHSPLQVGSPFSTRGSTWAFPLSGFHLGLFSGNTGKRLVCKGREGTGLYCPSFLLPPELG